MKGAAIVGERIYSVNFLLCRCSRYMFDTDPRACAVIRNPEYGAIRFYGKPIMGTLYTKHNCPYCNGRGWRLIAGDEIWKWTGISIA